MRLIRGILVALTIGLCAGRLVASTNAIPWRTPLYTLTARAMPVRQALETFGVAEGVPVLLSDAAGGVVSGDFRDMPAGDFLDRIATINNLVWYYDGATLYVYGASEIVSTMLELKYMKAGELRQVLDEFGIQDDRYPIKSAQNDELIMVSGPPRYVQMVAEMIARADRLREVRTFNEIEVRLFPLTYTWADNVSLSVSSSESSMPIKGIAQLLEEITKTEASDRTKFGTNDLSVAEEQRSRMGLTFRPTILPENRLNAVLVRDVATRMPMYERLIRVLDKPQKLLDISITTIELSKEDAFEWQNSLSVSGRTDSDWSDSHFHDASAGSNVDNLMTPGGISGKGVSAAYTYIGKNIEIGASISALKSKGKTRGISRTSVLTMNNMAASITDTQSYNARVTGERVANLQSVSAGTTFRFKPRAVKPVATNDRHRVWMTLEATDGGFESEKVDGMPMTRTTTVMTQAVMNEGESLVVAGYLRDVDGEAGWGIPWLRDIPWIGWLFGGASDVKQTVQRFFVLTPRVIEVAGPETAIAQVTAQRDLTEADGISEALDRTDDERKLRKQEMKERRTILEELAEDRYERRSAEIERDENDRSLLRKMEQDELDDLRRQWKDDYERRKEEYERARDEKERARDEKTESAPKIGDRLTIKPQEESQEKPQEGAN